MPNLIEEELAPPGATETGVAVQANALVKHYRSRAGVIEAVRGVDLTRASR